MIEMRERGGFSQSSDSKIISSAKPKINAMAILGVQKRVVENAIPALQERKREETEGLAQRK